MSSGAKWTEQQLRDAGWSRLSLRLRKSEAEALERIAKRRKLRPGRTVAALILEADKR